MSNLATIGHNNPPEPTPYELSKQAIEDLYEEAKLWLDGDPVSTQEQADALNVLADRIRKAAKEAEDRRKAEAKPFDDGKAEVQARYNPLIQKGKGKADLALDTVKNALRPFLVEQEQAREEQARKAREEADRQAREAREAMQDRHVSNLEEREQAEQMVKEAKEAEKIAARLEHTKVHAKGDARATGLRTVWRAEMTDKHEAAAWVWKNRNDELMVFVQEIADKAVRSGARFIPGFTVKEEKVL